MKDNLHWIHPSMRDLAIDYLVTHAAERLDFLARAGVGGVLLAVSTGGGEAGERSLPLLQSKGDWRVLEERASGLVGTCPDSDVGRLLSAVDSLLRQTDQSNESADRQQITSFATELMNSTRLRWDDGGAPIPIPYLRMYFKVTARLDLYLPTPQLGATWDSWDMSRRIHARTLSFDHSELDALAWWLALLQLIETWEPRWLRFTGFSQQRESVLSALVSQLATMVDELDSLDADEQDDETGVPVEPEPEESDELDTLVPFMECIEILEELVEGSDLQTCRSVFEAAEAHVQTRQARAEAREEFEVDERDHDEPWTSGFGAPPNRDIDVKEIFSDL